MLFAGADDQLETKKITVISEAAWCCSAVLLHRCAGAKTLESFGVTVLTNVRRVSEVMARWFDQCHRAGYSGSLKGPKGGYPVRPFCMSWTWPESNRINSPKADAVTTLH